MYQQVSCIQLLNHGHFEDGCWISLGKFDRHRRNNRSTFWSGSITSPNGLKHPLTKVDQETVIDFIQTHILYRFGIPETITTDQGSVFVGQKMQDFAVEIGFKLNNSTPYYAQANGQVEAANKVLINLIKKHVAKKPKNWHKTLNQILWACRTSPKEATGITPFRLAYGHDAVLLSEICLQSTRM